MAEGNGHDRRSSPHEPPPSHARSSTRLAGILYQVLRADDDERGGAAHGLALESFGLRCVYAGDISSGQDALARDHYGAA